MALVGSQGIVVKCTATICFRTVDWNRARREETREKKNVRPRANYNRARLNLVLRPSHSGDADKLSDC